MPSFYDGAFIFVIALLLFGPKKLPELARQLGKLMGEFRRASNDFRMQMEDELRMAEQADRQKKIAEIEAAAPAAPALEASTALPSTDGQTYEPVDYVQTETEGASEYHVEDPALEVLPIASEGDLKMMPPETGLPVGRSPEIHGESASVLAPLLEGIPEATPAEVDRHTIHTAESAVDQHG
jgi:sec-independent protein translocase protein TatB